MELDGWFEDRHKWNKIGDMLAKLYNESTRIKYKEIYETAYRLMDEPVIEGNCGNLCGFHCCRSDDEGGERLGMYLEPLEYEYMQKDLTSDFDIQTQPMYDMPPKIKKRYYIYCDAKEGCLRNGRPIQCRTYPFEPHIEEGVFTIVIEKAQIHECPLLDRIPEWRQAFIEGVYKGWLELMKIPIVKYNTLYFSKKRIEADNIWKQYDGNSWEDRG